MSNGGSSGGRGVNADWDQVEEDLFKLSHEIKPIFKTRFDSGFTINRQLANRIEQTLNKIKGQTIIENSENGDLDIDEFLRYKVDNKQKQFKTWKFLKKKTRKMELI